MYKKGQKVRIKYEYIKFLYDPQSLMQIYMSPSGDLCKDYYLALEVVQSTNPKNLTGTIVGEADIYDNYFIRINSPLGEYSGWIEQDALKPAIKNMPEIK